MKTTEIRRTASALSDVGCLSDTIEQQAAELLGYSAKQVHERATGELGPLAAALAKLEIEVLDPRDVHRYQMEGRHEAEREFLAQRIASNDASVLNRMHKYEWPSWDERELKNYTLPVPEFVLNKALQIKKELPDVRFYVESLETHPDPFLVVKYGQYDSEVYHVEVWAEPKFEIR